MLGRVEHVVERENLQTMRGFELRERTVMTTLVNHEEQKMMENHAITESVVSCKTMSHVY